MVFGKVVGSVVSTNRSDKLEGYRYRLVEKCDRDGKGMKDFLVALDLVNSSHDDLVLMTQGSSCSWTEVTKNKPFDTLIVGIVDLVDEMGTLTYKK